MRSFLLTAAIAALTFAQTTEVPASGGNTNTTEPVPGTSNTTTTTTTTTGDSTNMVDSGANSNGTPVSDGEPIVQELKETQEEWNKYWNITVEIVIEQVINGELDNVPRNEEDLRTLLVNSNLEWVLDIKAEAFMVNDPSWDQQALRKVMQDLDYYLMMEWNIYVDSYVIQHFGLHDFSIMKMDFYFATAMSIIDQVAALPWIEEEQEANYLMSSQLADIARILVQHKIPITVAELESYQSMALQFLVDFDLQSEDDITEEKICQIMDAYIDEWDVSDYNFRSCEQFVEGTYFNIFLNWFQDETDVDLRAYGLNSLDDVSEEIIFAIVAHELEKQKAIVLSDYNVKSLDDIDEKCIIKIAEDQKVPITEEDKKLIEENFGPVKEQVIEAGKRAQEAYAQFMETTQTVTTGAEVVLASMAAVTTAVFAFAF